MRTRESLAIGDEVEWDMFRGTDRGKVYAITGKRVFVRNQRIRTRGRGAGTPLRLRVLVGCERTRPPAQGRAVNRRDQRSIAKHGARCRWPVGSFARKAADA